MTTKKKAAKKVTKKRAPRTLWVAMNPGGYISDTDRTRRAVEGRAFEDDTIHGPYILAERVRER